MDYRKHKEVILNRPFKNKFFIIVICLGVLLSAGAIASKFGGLGLNNAVGIILLPIERVVDYIAGGIDGYNQYFGEFDRLKAENAGLKEHISSMQGNIEDAEKTLSENEWLRGFFKLKIENEHFELMDAQIISRRSGNVMSELTIDKGTFHGVKLNCPVITSSGIIGSVTELGATYCKISTLLSPSSGVSAYIRRTGEIGIVESSFEYSLEGKYIIRYLPQDCDVQPGDAVISSGLGSIFPKGLVIGYIESLQNDPFSHTVYGVVTPADDIESVKKVMVILSTEMEFK